MASFCTGRDWGRQGVRRRGGSAGCRAAAGSLALLLALQEKAVLCVSAVGCENATAGCSSLLQDQFDGSSFEAWGGGAWYELSVEQEASLGAWGESGAREVFTAEPSDGKGAAASSLVAGDWNPLDPSFDYYGRRLQAADAATTTAAPAGATTEAGAAGAGGAGGTDAAARAGGVIPGQDDNTLSAERVYPACGKDYVAMYFNADYQEMNATVIKNCRVRVENKLQGCCNTVRFKEWGENPLAMQNDIVEGCSTCSVNCEHFYFAQFCNDYFGKACQVKRRPLTGLDFEIIETFCVPTACTNQHDIKGVLSFFDIRYRRVRSGWRYNYRDGAELICDTGMMETILIAIGALVFLIGGIMLLLFLCKPPAESKKPQSRRREKGAS